MLAPAAASASTGAGTSAGSAPGVAATVTAPAAAPIAPLIEPPSEFGHVAPGIYRCSASSLTQGLPSAPRGWSSTQQNKPTWPSAQTHSTTNGAKPPRGRDDGKGPAALASLGAHPLQASASSSSHTNGSSRSSNKNNKSSAISNGIHSHQAGVLHSSFPFIATPASRTQSQGGHHSQQSHHHHHHHHHHQSASYSAWAATALPTEVFLSSLQLRTILFLGPERKPTALAAWCAAHGIRLVHLGLGALADDSVEGGQGAGSSGTPSTLKGTKNDSLPTSTPSEGVTRARSVSLLNGARFSPLAKQAYATSGDEASVHQRIRVSQTWWEPHGATTASPADRMSPERIAKDALELLLNRHNLPCLICDMTGVKETGIAVGCLRRLQRFNFASIRLEYRTWAGNRARASHERFIEMFDTDLITLPADGDMPEWFADQLREDEEAEEALMQT